MNNNTELQQTELSTKLIIFDKFKMLIFVLILGLISAGILVVLDHYTEPIIEKNIELRLKESILKAFAFNYNKDNIETTFSDKITVVQTAQHTVYRTSEGAVALRFTGNGLWGAITGIVALNSNRESLRGIAIIEQRETPGLGGRISEDSFQQQFRGVKINPKIEILPASEKAEKANEVDGITGATLTSKSLENILNKETKKIIDLIEKGVNTSE